MRLHGPSFLSLVPYLALFEGPSSAYLLPQTNCTICLPNPIAATYPNNVTGAINATTSVILVPLPYVRSLLPSRFANSILTHAYTRFNIPPTSYPLVVEASIDHDIRYNNIVAAADFSSFRTTFPFIDLLGDGYSSYRYTGYIYLPPKNLVAIQGSEAYGYDVLPGFFDPPDAAYRYAFRRGKNTISAVYTNTSSSRPHRAPKHDLVASTHFHPSSTNSIPLSFYKNITNQPMFGNNTAVCDKMISFWNTSVTTGEYVPQTVVGDVLLTPPMVPRAKVWRGVQGVKAQRAFLEVNYLKCESLKGYGGTGSGDSG
ncbi:MAG: hypothetical protein Q9166_006911 [cf. Caloplaca sp. 2 TL-2023]